MNVSLKLSGVWGFLALMVFMSMWVFGAVLAKGFWSTFFSIFFFPWGWYLVVEKIAIHFGVL